MDAKGKEGMVYFIFKYVNWKSVGNMERESW